jgi:hypothetical protein
MAARAVIFISKEWCIALEKMMFLDFVQRLTFLKNVSETGCFRILFLRNVRRWTKSKNMILTRTVMLERRRMQLYHTLLGVSDHCQATNITGCGPTKFEPRTQCLSNLTPRVYRNWPLRIPTHPNELHARPWWWRQYAPLKLRSTSTWLHDATSQKPLYFILVAVTAWNLTQNTVGWRTYNGTEL